MATKFIQQPPILASHVFIPPSPTNYQKPILTRFRESPSPTSCHLRFPSHSSVKAAENRSELAAAANDDVITEQDHTLAQIKLHLFAALQGINRGIFGMPSEKKTEIECLVDLLESQNPTPQPTLSLDKLGGTWKLIYSTITILGSKRTKLGLRDFITLGDFFQSINVTEQYLIMEGKAVNVIKFSAKGLNLLRGQLTIDASFRIASKSRVDISYKKSVITPDQLMNIFHKNYDLLLQIFNPEGWLEITYVDDSLRIGRDNKGNIFILERVCVEAEKP